MSSPVTAVRAKEAPGNLHALLVPPRHSWRCRRGWHLWRDVTIKWANGGPYMEWMACARCSQIEDRVDQVKDWRPFDLIWD